MKNAKGLSFVLIPLVLAAVALTVPGRPFAQEVQVEKPKLLQENYQLLTDADLYCSFYMHEEGKALPDTWIVGAERMNEKVQLTDADLVYLNKGKNEGLEMGQLFEVIGMEEKVPPYGWVMQRCGRARVVRLDDAVAVAKIERACADIRVGDFLVPYEEKEGEIAKDKGFGWMDPNTGKHGEVIYIDTGYHISASGQWALINMGRQQCIQIGDQLTVFHQARPDLPREAIGNMIVVDVRGATSTVKILSCRDSVEVGNEVQIVLDR